MSTKIRPTVGQSTNLVRSGRISIVECNEGSTILTGLDWASAHRWLARLKQDYPGKRLALRSEWVQA